MIKDINDWKEKIKKADKLIIVEGIKDKEALRVLGIKKVITLKNKPLYKVIEEAAEKTKEAIILTDFDKEGKKIYSILKKGLQKHRIKVDMQFREFLIKNTEVSCIEGITNLFL